MSLVMAKQRFPLLSHKSPQEVNLLSLSKWSVFPPDEGQPSQMEESKDSQVPHLFSVSKV